MVGDGVKEGEGVDLDGRLLGPPGPLIHRVAEPAFGAQQVEDVSQQDYLDFLDVIAGFGGNSRHILEEIFKSPMGEVVLPGGAIHEMQVTDEHEHAWLSSRCFYL